MSDPLVSIIIPVYNADKYLAETVQSALKQTWRHKEIIIVDDGSTDESLQVAESFKSEIVKVFTQKNKGASAARNIGLKEAKGDYIQFLDADDLLSPDKIKMQLADLNGSLTHLAICKTVHFNDGENHLNGKLSNNWFCNYTDNLVDFLTKLYAGDEVMPGYGGIVTVHSWLTPRNLIEKAGCWNEKLSVDDDGEFFCRVVLAAEGIKFTDKEVNYYRKFNNRQSLSGQKSKKAFESAILAIDLKVEHMKAQTQDIIVDRVFAGHYWCTGVMAYPQFKYLSKHCIQTAARLGYSGKKYIGGPVGHFFAGLFGWKAARIIFRHRQLLKKLLA